VAVEPDIQGTEAEGQPESGATDRGNGATGRQEPMIDLHDPKRRQAVEASLRSLEGVIAARLVPGFDRPVDELHVVASPDRSPKPLVRDIQSLLFARFGISIDHRVCSVVQFEAAPEGIDAVARLAIDRVSTLQQGMDIHAWVYLADGEESLEGVSSGPASAAGRRRAVARAALKAVRPRLAARESVEIEGVDLIQMLGHDIAVTLVHSHGPDGARTLAGTAIVDDDENVTVARSVLNAVNRQVAEAAQDRKG
jgi:hypothetical protein